MSATLLTTLSTSMSATMSNCPTPCRSIFFCRPPCRPPCPPPCRPSCGPPCQPPQCCIDAFWGLRGADRMEIQKYDERTDWPTGVGTRDVCASKNIGKGFQKLFLAEWAYMLLLTRECCSAIEVSKLPNLANVTCGQLLTLTKLPLWQIFVVGLHPSPHFPQK